MNQPKFSPVTPITGRINSAAADKLEERFATLEGMVHSLKTAILDTRARAQRPLIDSKAANIQAVKDLVSEQGAVTVTDIHQRLGVSVKTANRLIHTAAHAGHGRLLLEPSGARERLVLFHPDLVIIDDPRQ